MVPRINNRPFTKDVFILVKGGNMKFKSLEKTKTKLQEDEVNKYWDSIGILNETIKNREGNKPFVFFEFFPLIFLT